MTVGELRKLLDDFEDEETIGVIDDVGGRPYVYVYDVLKVQYTVTGPKIYIGS